MTARIFNVLIGTWLIASAFGWGSGGALARYTVICGALTAITAIATIFYDRARYLSLAVVGVLFIATGLLASRHTPTFWNNMLCGAAIGVGALIGHGGRTSLREERDQYSRT